MIECVRNLSIKKHFKMVISPHRADGLLGWSTTQPCSLQFAHILKIKKQKNNAHLLKANFEDAFARRLGKLIVAEVEGDDGGSQTPYNRPVLTG